VVLSDLDGNDFDSIEECVYSDFLAKSRYALPIKSADHQPTPT
jgi:hypothetical protein